MEKKVISLVLVCMLVMTILSGCGKENGKIEESEALQEKVIPVEVTNPKMGSISQQIVLNGELQPVNEVTVIPKVAGMIEITDVKVKLGDRVKKGDVLFILDKEDISDQIENARLAYETALKNYNKIKEGIENAKVNFERIKKLYEEGVVSKQQYEQAKLQASHSQLEALDSQVNQAKFAYENAKELLDNAIVTSPIDGIVSLLNVNEKEMTTSQPAAVITDISTMEVEIDVTESIINKIIKGKAVDILVPSISDEVFEGVVNVVNPVSDMMTKLYKVKILVNNDSGLLKPGMFSRVFLNLDEKNDILTLPVESVLDEDGKKFVYLVEDNRAVRKEIKVGEDNGEVIEIKSGLKTGDKIIIKGQDFVKDGNLVRIVRGE